MESLPSAAAGSRRVWEWPLALALLIASALYSYHIQDEISYQAGFGWDGVEYARVAGQMATGTALSAEAPFVYRPGTPWLVARLFPDDILQGFRSVNLPAVLLAPLLLFLWLRGFTIRSATRILLLCSFMLAWHAPLRFVPFYPVYVDPWMWVLWLSGLLLLKHTPRHTSVIWLLPWMVFALLAAFFREVLLLLPLLLALRELKLPARAADGLDWLRTLPGQLRSFQWIQFLPFLSGLLLLLMIQASAHATNDYGFGKTAIIWTYQKGLPHMLHGAMLAFSPLVLLGAVAGWKHHALWLEKDRSWPLLFLLFLLCFSWIGGSDTERILYWCAPILFVYAGQGIDLLRKHRKGLILLFLLLVTEIIGQRWLLPTPDYAAEALSGFPFLTFWGENSQYLDLYSFHGERRLEALSLAQYILLYGLFGYWLRKFLQQLPSHEQ